MRSYVVMLLLCVWGSPVMASEQGFLIVKTGAGLSAAALNDATAANRTVSATLTDGGNASYSKWLVTVVYTYSSATTITAQFSCSVDGTNYGRRTSRKTIAGASTVYAETETYTTDSASRTLNLEYDVRGCKAAKVLLGGAGAGAGDTVSTPWAATAGS